MGGEGSGRKPDPVKKILGFGQPAPTEGETFYLPNLGGVKDSTRKDFPSGWTEGSVVFIGDKGDFTQDNANLFYDNTNNRLGIGTASPDSKLNIVSAGVDSTALIVQDNARKIKIGRDSVAVTTLGDVASDLYLTANDDIFFPGTGAWKNTGNVGIGTTAPGTNAHLEIAKDNPQLVLTDTSEGVNDKTFRFINIDERIGLTARQDGNVGDAGAGEVMSWERDGNVGIGVTDPHSKLEVNGAISSETANLTTSSDAYNVAAVNSIFVNSTTGNVVLGGLANGVVGQCLHIVKVTSSGALTIEHAEGSGTQKFILHAGADLIIEAGKYGGANFIYNGTSWFEIGSAH